MKNPAPNNRTLRLDAEAAAKFDAMVSPPPRLPLSAADAENRVFNAAVPECLEFFPDKFVDLLILDPPYNLDKDFHGVKFRASSNAEYLEYLESWFPPLLRLLKPDASVYLCCDWHNSAACFTLLEKYLTIRNRITWQREKGRGALRNWKNCSEDIWFATTSGRYTFNLDAVKQKRRVLAPYRENGVPKDWTQDENGEKFRLTCPSNLWDDISVPYWSMPENTDHPTQKPEKLLAKLILASSNSGDMVFDPFSGSGTTPVTARKLNRRYCAVEMNREYCRWTAARLEKAGCDRKIQGFDNGVFLERNSK
ncbi:MAG: site-specific DNA-methyltransferase [Victivallaceae bacterium]|nr:site-specific DNA-methyltransferase [Victivallaceae bacterium]